MGAIGSVIALSLLLTSCGQSTKAQTVASSDGVDRSDVVAVAEAMMTAFLALDFDMFRSLVVPEEQSMVDDLIAAAELGNAQPVEQVTVTATVIEQSGTSAIVDIDGRYCVPSRMIDVSVTTAGMPTEGDGSSGVADTMAAIEEPGQCFDLDEIFDNDAVEFRQIDGQWFGPLPT